MSTDLAAKARTLLDLHTAPEILVLANVWDVVSAQVVASTPARRRWRRPATRSPPPSVTPTARRFPSTCT